MPIIQPAVNGMIGSSPHNSAFLTGQQKNELLTNLNKIGGLRRKKGGSIEVPSVPNQHLIHDPSSNTSQGIGNQIINGTKITAQNDANSVYDSKAVLVQVPKGSTVGGKISKKKTYKKKNSKKMKRNQKHRKTKKNKSTRK